ncbi:DUF2878 domain-containing protein [Lysobacter humi (ex Lee et al. 2017)]
MNRLLDIAGSQAVWFATVIGAGQGIGWLGPVAALPFAAWHVAASTSRLRIAVLVAAALACGLLLDGLLAGAGALEYAASGRALFGVPPWILGLWVVFALTLRCSLAILQRRLVVAGLFGAVGGPLAYLGAARGWGAVVFPPDPLPTLLMLGVGWATALPVLAGVARWSAASNTPAPAVRVAA